MVVVSLIAGGLALALLVLIYWRTAQRYQGLQDEVERLRVVQRDMSSDVRARLEEGAKTWEHVEREMRPRLEQLEPSVADLSAALQENLPALNEARARPVAVEGRIARAEADLRAALEGGEERAEERAERIEQAVRTLRNAADERLAELSARVAQLETPPEPVPADEPDIDFDVVAEGAPETDEEAALAAATDAEATYGSSRGTPAPDRSGKGGRWVVILLALVTGLALVFTALS